MKFSLLSASIAFMWLYSGLQPLLTASDAALQLLTEMGISTVWCYLLLLAASLLDCLFALWTLIKPNRFMWYAQATTVSLYTILITLYLPQAWLHPLGAVVKNLPLIALMLYLAHRTEPQKI